MACSRELDKQALGLILLSYVVPIFVSLILVVKIINIQLFSLFFIIFDGAACDNLVYFINPIIIFYLLSTFVFSSGFLKFQKYSFKERSIYYKILILFGLILLSFVILFLPEFILIFYSIPISRLLTQFLEIVIFYTSTIMIMLNYWQNNTEESSNPLAVFITIFITVILIIFSVILLMSPGCF